MTPVPTAIAYRHTSLHDQPSRQDTVSRQSWMISSFSEDLAPEKLKLEIAGCETKSIAATEPQPGRSYGRHLRIGMPSRRCRCISTPKATFIPLPITDCLENSA